MPNVRPPRIRIRKPVVKPEPKPDQLEAVVTLLLALEETLTGSSPDQEKVRELYAKLKEAV